MGGRVCSGARARGMIRGVGERDGKRGEDF